jgi:7-cyano-7-deazaguanine synthase
MDKGILLSGGMDSIALAYWKKPNVAFTIDYGQRPAKAEISASEQICKLLNIHHEIIIVDCKGLGSGDLSESEKLSIAPSSEWWPYRNQLLITLASMRGVSLGLKSLMVGSVKSDGFHRDGTEIFYKSMNSLMNYQEGGIVIESPAIHLSTIELIQVSSVPDEILFWAHSCHKFNHPCGHCRGCYKYIEVIEKLGLQ